MRLSRVWNPAVEPPRLLSPLPSLSFYSGLCQQRQNFFLNRSGHASLAFPDIHIHLAAHSEFWQVNSRFNRIARMRNQVPYVVSFKPVHIHAVAVHFLSNAVARAVKEVFSVTCFFNDASRRFVHLPSLQRLP